MWGIVKKRHRELSVVTYILQLEDNLQSPVFLQLQVILSLWLNDLWKVSMSLSINCLTHLFNHTLLSICTMEARIIVPPHLLFNLIRNIQGRI